MRLSAPALVSVLVLTVACGEDPADPGTGGTFSIEVTGTRTATLSGSAELVGDPLVAFDLTLIADADDRLDLSFSEGSNNGSVFTVDENTRGASGEPPMRLGGDSFFAVSGVVSINAGSASGASGFLDINFVRGVPIRTDSVTVRGPFSAERPG
ncbi:MAG: hypothetical protein ABFS34_15925 [Gemmatimonadota bacterium]